MSSEGGVLGSFASPGDAARAIRALRASGFPDVRAAMPAAYPQVLNALGRPRSPIAFASLPGAVVGRGPASPSPSAPRSSCTSSPVASRSCRSRRSW